MTIEKKELEREREKMVTLLLSGSGVDVTSMQDCFIQAGQEDLWSSIMRRGSKGRIHIRLQPYYWKGIIKI